MSEDTHGSLICLRCGVGLDPRSGYCRQCGRSLLPNPGDPPALHVERGFLLDAALTLTDPAHPRLLDIPEDVLEAKAAAKPDLPLGPPVPPELDAVDPDGLAAFLDSPHPRHRGAAALRLGMSRSPRASGRLLEHLSDRDGDVRRCILWSLGRARNTSLSGPLAGYYAVEKDPVMRLRIAATLYALLVPPLRDLPTEEAGGLEAAHRDVREEPSARTHMARGLLHLKLGSYAKAVGDFTRTGDCEGGDPSPQALFYRSEAFLLLGKPLFSMDDLLRCPKPEVAEQLPEFLLHRAALVALGRQISDAAQARGLTDYADLFLRRIQALMGG
ncbi:MAG: HEAT repeat domain-containing protein [Deltaproteobacteria bacterium]|nr:HEAT repeat domain-containing protein [Deltaproteobacteria bacterium]